MSDPFPAKPSRVTPAECCWLGLGAYVLASDVFLWRRQQDTMSIQFGRWIETKPGKILCLLGTAGMIAHLFWGLPLPMQTQAKRYLGGYHGHHDTHLYKEPYRI